MRLFMMLVVVHKLTHGLNLMIIFSVVIHLSLFIFHHWKPHSASSDLLLWQGQELPTITNLNVLKVCYLTGSLLKSSLVSGQNPLIGTPKECFTSPCIFSVQSSWSRWAITEQSWGGILVDHHDVAVVTTLKSPGHHSIVHSIIIKK